MKIIKRSGKEVGFDGKKIIAAIEKANNEVTPENRLTEEQMQFIKEMPLSYECEYHGHKLHFSHFLFTDINAAYPFYQLSSLKTGEFDKACASDEIKKYDLAVVGHCHQNFIKGNVAAVSAAGLEGASYLIIDVNDDTIGFEHISLE